MSASPADDSGAVRVHISTQAAAQVTPASPSNGDGAVAPASSSSSPPAAKDKPKGKDGKEPEDADAVWNEGRTVRWIVLVVTCALFCYSVVSNALYANYLREHFSKTASAGFFQMSLSAEENPASLPVFLVFMCLQIISQAYQYYYTFWLFNTPEKTSLQKLQAFEVGYIYWDLMNQALLIPPIILVLMGLPYLVLADLGVTNSAQALASFAASTCLGIAKLIAKSRSTFKQYGGRKNLLPGTAFAAVCMAYLVFPALCWYSLFAIMVMEDQGSFSFKENTLFDIKIHAVMSILTILLMVPGSIFLLLDAMSGLVIHLPNWQAAVRRWNLRKKRPLLRWGLFCILISCVLCVLVGFNVTDMAKIEDEWDSSSSSSYPYSYAGAAAQRSMAHGARALPAARKMTLRFGQAAAASQRSIGLRMRPLDVDDPDFPPNWWPSHWETDGSKPTEWPSEWPWPVDDWSSSAPWDWEWPTGPWGPYNPFSIDDPLNPYNPNTPCDTNVPVCKPYPDDEDDYDDGDGDYERDYSKWRGSRRDAVMCSIMGWASLGFSGIMCLLVLGLTTRACCGKTPTSLEDVLEKAERDGLDPQMQGLPVEQAPQQGTEMATIAVA